MTFTRFELQELSWNALETEDKAYNKIVDLVEWMEESDVESVILKKAEGKYQLSAIDENSFYIHQTGLTVSDITRNK